MLSFTLVFGNQNNYQTSYQLAFEPCPVWKSGEHIILNPHPSDPYFRGSEFADLLKYLKNERNKIGNLDFKKDVVLIADVNWQDNGGYASENMLDLLVESIKIEGYTTQTVFI